MHTVFCYKHTMNRKIKKCKIVNGQHMTKGNRLPIVSSDLKNTCLLNDHVCHPPPYKKAQSLIGLDTGTWYQYRTEYLL